MSANADARVLITGENPFLRLSEKDGDPNSTDASFWRVLLCPAGPGHVLFLKSELTQDQWRIYSDNIAMARWLQQTVQGMLSADLKDPSISVIDAAFSRSGDPRYFWTENVAAHNTEIALTWYDIGEPILVNKGPNEPPNPRPLGLSTVLVPAFSARLSFNGTQAKGQPWRREREGRPFSTSALAFSESWTEPR
jgi:hypothetical protein